MADHDGNGFTYKVTIFKIAKKSTNIWASYCQDLYKMPQYDHTITMEIVSELFQCPKPSSYIYVHYPACNTNTDRVVGFLQK